MNAKFVSGASAICLLLAANIASAVDGAYQINSACAAVGCFAGDSAGYPVTITQPGTYDLVGDLTIADQVASAIVVQANNVTIEMNGFRIIGPVTCSGPPTNCTPSTVGAGNVGIDGWSYSPTNLVVRNGSVTGMGTGILASYDGRVEHVQAIQNGDAGIRARIGTAVSDSTGTYNGHVGVEAGLMIKCVASHNGQYGLAGTGTAAGGSLIKDSLATFNDSYGVYLGGSGNVVGTTVVENNVGMYTDGGASQVLDSLFASNTLVGVTVHTGVVGIARSTFNGNNSGGLQWGGSVVQMGTNLCGSSTTCP